MKVLPTYGATIAFISATLCIAVGFEVGSDKIRTSGKRVVGTYYLAFGELLGSPATQINSLVLVTAGIAINLSLQRHGSFWLIGFALAVSNTPLNSYFSRNPTTWLVLRTCPRTWVFYAQFACQLSVCHAVCATIRDARTRLVRHTYPCQSGCSFFLLPWWPPS